jgi:NTE family protein
MSAQNPNILFCWSGGGIAGLDIHTGIWSALDRAGIESTANCGTSAGAIMAALNSANQSAWGTNKLIRSLTDDDVRDERFAWALRMLSIDSFMLTDKIEGLLAQLLPATFEELRKPLLIFATDDVMGTSASFDSGELRKAVLASMSIAGVFTPVTYSGGIYSDGGTTNNAAIPSLESLDRYDEVYVLIAEPPIHYIGKDNMLTRLRRNADFLINGQMAELLAAVAMNPHVHVLRPPAKVLKGSMHFDHDLISEAELWVAQELRARGLWKN